MNDFVMNGYLWRIKYVDPKSPLLIDRTGSQRVATTDPRTRCTYIANNLTPDFLNRVLLHELGHVAMFSYDLIGDIHQAVNPEYWIEAEEWVCNFIADFGLEIFAAAYRVLGEQAWVYVPQELERLFA